MAVTFFEVEVNNTKIPVIFEKDNRLPLASVEFIFKDSGTLASKKAGLVSLAADLLNEGSKKDGSMKFAKELEDNAIEFSVNSGNETFVFTLESLKERFDFGLKKVIELINEPNYSDEAFKKVVTKRVGVLARKADDFDYIANNGLKELLFKGTPLANPRLGTIESIKSLKLEDLKNFIDTHLYKNNLLVVIGGDFSEDEVREVVKKFASNLKSGEVKKLQKIKVNENNQSKEINKDTKQAYIYFGAPYYMESNDTKRVIGKVASFILGSSGFGSRLMEEVRVKRGLAYSAYSRFIVNRTNSYFFGYLQTKLENQDEAIGVVKEVINKFLKEGATQKELDSAKKFFLGSEPLRSETLMQRLNRAFNEYYSGLGLGFSKKELEIIKNLTLKELNDFIKNHQEINKLSFFIVTNKQK
ncbi:MAG: insulinase family protein [Epsilonproteobacteria bacterium]|nr:insulinase family protein [Campylobacterota bacterium]